jgi:hypothetical protein
MISHSVASVLIAASQRMPRRLGIRAGLGSRHYCPRIALAAALN